MRSSNGTVRRRVSIRNGKSIIKEVENARLRYQSVKRADTSKETLSFSPGDYSETDELIKRLSEANIELSTIQQ